MNNTERKQKLERALYEVRVFIDSGKTAGMPSDLFWVGVGLTIFSCLQMPVLFALGFGMCWLIGMYLIHKQDDKAIHAWRKAIGIKRPWYGNRRQNMNLIFLQEE